MIKVAISSNRGNSGRKALPSVRSAHLGYRFKARRVDVETASGFSQASRRGRVADGLRPDPGKRQKLRGSRRNMRWRRLGLVF